MPRSVRAAVVSVLLALAAGTVVACGGGGGHQSATALIDGAFGPGQSITSAKLDIKLGLRLDGVSSLKGPVRVAVSGPFQSAGKGKPPRFAIDLAVSAAGTHFTAGAVSTGTAVYLTLQGKSYALDGSLGKQLQSAFAAPPAKGAKGKGSASPFASLGIDPEAWVKDPKVVGDEKAGGVDATHVTAGIDVPKLLDDLNTALNKLGGAAQGAVPTKLSAKTRDEVARSIKSTALDLWTAKSDGTLRRLRLHVAIDVPSDVRKSADGLTTGDVSFDMTLADVNRPQTISAPANAKPLSDLGELLGGLLGAAGSSGAGSGLGTLLGQ